MTDFTPIDALTGGGLIGLASVLLMLSLGRIAGISGILSGLLPPGAASRADIAWRVAFIIGLVLGGAIWALFMGHPGEIMVSDNLGLLIAGGFSVGLGTRMGSGCTSGHGVCGIGRLSPRGIIATCIFMAVAAATVFALRHGIGG